MPEGFASYLEGVGESIRWHRARSFALRELRIHLLEQRDCFLEEGMTEQEAEEAAIWEMGDATMVGRELDAVHRPREQWFWLAAVVLLSCGVVFLRCYLTAGFAFEAPHPGKTFAALILGLAAMMGLYVLDYRILMHHAGKVYAAAILLGLLTDRFDPHVNHAAWHTRHVVLLYPAIYAIWLNKCRNKGWEGFFLAIFGGLLLAIIACMAPYMLVLFGGLLARAFRERNPFGRLLAIGALLPLLVQTTGATAQNLGYFVVSVPTPLFSGNLNTVLTMALLGLALSTLRQKDLPEEQATAPRTRWKLVLVRE